MSKPVLEYYWIKVLEDGETAIPQFDPETGRENRWDDDTIPVSKVLYVPFTIELSNKVTANGNPSIMTTNQAVEFVVQKDEMMTVEAGRDNAITMYDYFICDICGWKFQYSKEDGTKFATCPQCGTKDDWHCSRCNEFKEDYRITRKGQVQCLDCDIPVGLDRTVHLHRKNAVSHVCDYFIRTPTRKLTIKTDGNILVE